MVLRNSSGRRARLGVSLLLVYALTGCGESNEERTSQRDAERQQVRIQQQQRTAQLEREFTAKYFPPEGLNERSYTHEVQAFLPARSDENIVFDAYLKDIEAVADIVVVVVTVPIDEFKVGNREVVFRLNATEEHLAIFLDGDRPDPLFGSPDYFNEPGYIVVAQIDESRPIRKYEVYGSDAGDYIEVEQEESRNIVAIGSVEKVVASDTRE